MKRLFLLIIFPIALFAQNTTKGTIISGPAAARPVCSASFNATTANTGDIYNDTDDVNIWKCSGGSWSVLGGGLTGVQNNGVTATPEPFINFLSPLLVTTNSGNQSNDVSCPAYVGVGGSHASGCMIDPGASGSGTDYPGRDAQWHTSGSAATVKPDPATGLQYVAQICNGGGACSDANDGLSWGSAKLTPYAAFQALPNGATSPPTMGNGVVYVANDVNGIAFGGPVAGGHGGLWMMDSTDPNFASPPTGWMRVPTVGSASMVCLAPEGSIIHGGGTVCQEYWGGSSDNVHPSVWVSTGSGKFFMQGFSFSNQATGFKLGIDSNNNRSGNTGTSSVWFDRSQVNLGNCFTGVGAGPAVDIGGASFWLKFTHGSYSGCTTQDYSITAIARSSNTVTVTLNTSASPNDISAGNNNQIIIRNVSDKTFNGAYTITSASGTSVTYAQNGPNASSSGGQAFPYGAAAIGINSGTGPGAGFVYVLDATAVNGGGIWAQGGFNGVGLVVDHLVYEGNGLPDMAPVELLPLNSGGDTAIVINDVEPADNTVPICGVEALKGGNFSVTASLACGSLTSLGASVVGTASPLRQNMYGQYNQRSIAINSDLARNLFSPVAVRSPNQLGSGSGGWTTTGLTVTNGILAQDGTTRATRLVNPTGGTIQMNFGGFFAGATPQIGSYYVFGVRLRSETAGVLPISPNFNLNSSGLGAGDFCAGSYFSGQGASSITANVDQPSIIGDGQWNWYSGVCKIITAPSGGNQRLDMNVPANSTIDVDSPVLTLIAAGTITDNEAWEMANNLQSYPKAAAAGDISMLPGQRFAMATPGNLFMRFHQGTTTADRIVTWPDFAGTVGMFTGSPVNGNCTNWSVTGSVITLGDAGFACGSGGGGSGTVTAALLNSFTYYPQAGTTANVGGLNGITAPIGVFGFLGSTPTGGNLAGVPSQFLAGISGRTSTVASGTTADIITTDRAHRVKHTNAGATAIALPGTNLSDFTANFCYKEKVEGAGATDTITPGSGTINGAGSLVMKQGQAALVCSYDNSNYEADVVEVGGLLEGTNITFGRSDTGGLTINSSAGGGTVTHTGALTAGLVTGSGTADVTIGNLSGDCTTAVLVLTCTKLNNTAFAGTNGNLVAFGAANIPVDSTVVAANVITSTGTLLAGNVVSGTAAKNVGPTSIPTANLVTATAAASGANQICAAGGPNKTCSYQSLSDLSASGYAGTSAGTSTAYTACSASNPGTAVSTGTVASFLPNNANSSTTPTLNYCSLTAGAHVTKLGTAVLAVNDMVTTAIAEVIWDGTNWQLQNPQTTGGGGGSPAISSLTAAVASNGPLLNANNPQTWQWAQTTNSQNGLTLGESSASTAGTVTSNLANQAILEIVTLPASTSTPLSVAQGSITGTVAFPAFQVATTWNNASLVGQGIVFSVTDTAHALNSKLINIFGGAAGTTSEFSVDTSGTGSFLGGIVSGGTLRSTSATNSLTFQGGTDANTGGSANGAGIFKGASNTSTTANSAGGTATVNGGDATGSTANALIGGAATLRGGNANSSTSTSATGGSVTVQAGSCTAVTSASSCPGVVKVNQVAFTTGGAVANDLACVTATNTIASCTATGAGQFIGVIDSVTSNNVFFTALGAGGRHTFNALSASFTNGDFVCQDPSTSHGNLVVDSATVCTAGFGVGIYVGATGTTTTPVVMMRSY